MKPRSSIFIVLSIALVLVPSLRAAPPATQPATQPVFDKQLVTSANQFALDYYKSLAAKNDNVVVAPFGVFTFLSILREAADPAGAATIGKSLGLSAGPQPTRDHLHELTRLITTKDGALHIVCNMATQLWLDKSAAPGNAFLSALRDGYDADVVYTDFAGNPAAAQWSIRKWIHDQTLGLLQLEESPLLAVLCKAAMVNTIYFRAPWQSPFDRAQTKDGEFHVTTANTVKVPTMHVVTTLDFVHADGVQLLRLPYTIDEETPGAPNYEFIALLPDDATGLAKLEQNLTLAQLNQWITASTLTQEKLDKWISAKPNGDDLAARKKWEDEIPMKHVDLAMPRFDIAFQQDVRGTLEHMPGGDPLKITLSKAGTGIAPISQWEIMQGARIQVDETGTRAAAATYGGLFGDEGATPVVTIALDHPFLYLIRDAQTGTIIFLGRVSDPSQK